MDDGEDKKLRTNKSSAFFSFGKSLDDSMDRSPRGGDSHISRAARCNLRLELDCRKGKKHSAR